VWNIVNGKYQLVSCPLGHELVSTVQVCERCTAGYFCIGGSAARAACPAGTFSLPEANSSSACQSAVFILVYMTLGLAQASFTMEKQAQYGNAIAHLCSLSDYRVSIQSLAQAEWSVYGSDSIDVVFKIATSDSSSAELAVSNLKQIMLDTYLKEADLPEGILNYIKIDSQSQNFAPADWILAVACTGAALGVCVLLTIAWYLNQKVESPNERELRMKMAEIRRSLRITVKDGYAVGSEGQSLFTQRQLIFLSRAQVEAAANLALMQDFDVNQFDVLCLCIKHSGASEEAKERYELLGQWLLECCEFLLKPDFHDQEFHVDRSFHGNKRNLIHNPSERFQYFERRLIKARIWLEDKNLFSKLKIIAKRFMDELSDLCNVRYEVLCGEPRGQELVLLHLPRLGSSRYLSTS
jgi:hypothetical protein